MRAILLLLAFATLLAGCAGPEGAGPSESTGTGDEGVGSSGASGTGAGPDATPCPPPVETEAQLVTTEEANETACHYG